VTGMNSGKNIYLDFGKEVMSKEIRTLLRDLTDARNAQRSMSHTFQSL